jgi:hypothetical protein
MMTLEDAAYNPINLGGNTYEDFGIPGVNHETFQLGSPFFNKCLEVFVKWVKDVYVACEGEALHKSAVPDPTGVAQQELLENFPELGNMFIQALQTTSINWADLKKENYSSMGKSYVGAMLRSIATALGATRQYIREPSVFRLRQSLAQVLKRGIELSKSTNKVSFTGWWDGFDDKPSDLFPEDKTSDLPESVLSVVQQSAETMQLEASRIAHIICKALHSKGGGVIEGVDGTLVLHPDMERSVDMLFNVSVSSYLQNMGCHPIFWPYSNG